MMRTTGENSTGERALRESEAHFRTLSDATVEGIVIHEKGVIISANHSLARMFGYDDVELPGMDIIATLVAPGSRDVVRRHVRHELNGMCQMTGLRKDGARFPAEVETLQIKRGDRVLLGAAVRDVSERNRAAEALRESQRKLTTLMSNLPGMVYRCRNDPQWTMEFVSAGASDLTGYEPADLVDNTVIAYAEVIHPEDREQVWLDVQAAVEAAQPFRLLYRIYTAAGVEKWVWEQGRGVFAGDQLVALEGFITDVTGQKRVEQELERHQEELEHRIAERTSKLSATNRALEQEIVRRRESQHQVQQLQNELAHANRLSTMGEMAGSIAHELNQPLYAIVNYSGACLQELRSGRIARDRLEQNLEELEIQADRAGTIIRRLRDFAGKHIPRRSSFSIGEAIETAVQLLEADVHAIGATLKLDICDDSQTIQADRVQMQQLIVNLVHNALDALVEQEPAHREVRITASSPDELHVRVDIRDSGPGLAPGETERIFDPFYTTKPNGMGLGLSICRRIIETHGGRIWAPEQSDGTIISFTMPADAPTRSESADGVRR